MAKKYLMGLDLGTDSVGWCVTDENNKIIKKGGKSLWGARLFDEAQDCKSRRQNREARRRTQRRRERIDLLQLLFKEEIDKVDKNFFLRLNESFYKPEDKSEEIKNDNNYLFPNERGNDDFQYKTIYHLRNDLCNKKDKADIRLIYLAIAHMIKYRGNFLYDVSEFKPSDIQRVTELLTKINDTLDELDHECLSLTEGFAQKFNEKVLKAPGINAKKEELANLFGKEKYLSNVVYPLMSGGSISTKKIFEPEEDVEIDPKDFTFSSETADEALEKLSEQFPNDMHIELLKYISGVYDYLLIGKLLGDSTTISEAMVKRYEKHNRQLGELKGYVKEHLTKEDYNEIFRKKGNVKDCPNYAMYIGSSVSYLGKFRTSHCKASSAKDAPGFYKFIKEKLGIDKVKKADEITDPVLKNIYQEIENKTYLLRQNSTDNGVFPYQLNKVELLKILNTQSKYYPFLLSKDKEGISTIDKIVSLLTFKIPYYVGPLLAADKDKPSQRTSHSWVVRYSNEKIYPWNFDKIVNKDESASEFIKRMLNKCTYLPDCYCLPLNSLLFQRYQTLSLLNKTMVNGQLMSKEDKDGIVEKLFKKQITVSKKSILKFFKAKYGEDVSVTTSTGKELEEVNASMSSYCYFANKLGEEFVNRNIDRIEGIIKDLTVFEDSNIIEKRLKAIYELAPEQIKRIKDKRFVGWGRLSKELLEMTSQSPNEYGEVITVKLIDVMENTNFNLMELVNSDKYDFKKKIEEANQKADYNFASRKEKHQAIVDFVDDCYVSPGMKRPLIQSMAIIEDVEKIINHPIDEYYVECTRSNKAEKKVKDSRQKDLIKKYDEAKKLTMSAMIKESFDRSFKELKEEKDLGRFRSDKFYLYLTQMGKCAYTLKDIDLAELFNDDSAYDIDHIIPQALVKDDSIENRVLVCSNVNREKTSTYPIPSSLKAPGANAFYKILLKAKLIGEKKYSNLTRTTELTDEERLSFVNRQLVYTNQAVKALVDVIKTFEKDSHGNSPKVVYSKAENVSDFRRDYGIIKVRDANHFHHAHDAYLNICVGRAIDTYFDDAMKRNFGQYKNGYKSMNVKKIFIDNEEKNRKPLVDKDGNVVWDYQKSLIEIKDNIFENHNILTTTMQYVKGGSLTNKVTIHPAIDDRDGNLLPVKGSGPIANTSKYGGRSDPSYSFYTLVKRRFKKKTLISVIQIPLMYANKIDFYLKDILKYEIEEILIPCMRVNSILRIGNSKVCITGFSGDSMLLKNLIEPIFSEADLTIIKKVRKLLDIVKKNNIDIAKEDMDSEKVKALFRQCDNGEKLIISPASSKRSSEIALTKTETSLLYDCFVRKAQATYFSCLSGVKSFYDFVSLETSKRHFDDRNFLEQCSLLSQMLLVIGPSITWIDLSLLGGKKSTGRTRISSNLSSNISVVVESPTGYYTKVLWKGQE